jgi:hypothetical protein
LARAPSKDESQLFSTVFRRAIVTITALNVHLIVLKATKTWKVYIAKVRQQERVLYLFVLIRARASFIAYLTTQAI